VRLPFWRRRRDDDLDEEIHGHLEMAARDRVERGERADEAARAAHREFGNVGLIKELTREMWGWASVERLAQDLSYGLRLMRRDPGFTTVAILSLALGIGANTLVFSVVNALVLKPLPVAHPERVFFVQPTGRPYVSFSYPAYKDLRDRNSTFDALIGYRMAPMSIEALGSTNRMWGYLATGNYFDALGVQPVAGRFFHQDDDRQPGDSPFAVLSYEAWTARFSRDPRIVGTIIHINRLPYTVLGVAPPGFHGTELFYRPEIWVPMMMEAQIEVGNPWLDTRRTWNTWVAGRTKPGVSVGQAEANLNAIGAELGREYPGSDAGLTVKLAKPGLAGDALRGPVKAFTLGVLLLAGLVLIAACANLAGMLMARGADRQREMAIRVSMGAGAGRLARQLLTETLLLAALGGVAGCVVAILASSALSAWRVPVELPLQFDVHPDAQVFMFAFAIATLAGILFGLAPARQASKTDPNAALKGGDGRRSAPRRWATRDLLVAAQVTVCVVLLSACLLSLRGLQQALTMPLGFDPRGVTVAGFELGLAGYTPEQGERFQQRARDAVAQLPGVRAAAYSNSLPLTIDQSSTTIYPADQPGMRRSDGGAAVYYQVSPGFFPALGIRLIAGREFDWRDNRRSPEVAIVNAAFARIILRADDAIGRRFRYGPNGPFVEVVGVVEDGKYQSLTESSRPVVFKPILQSYNSTTTLFVRSSLPEEQIVAAMRQAIAGLDRGLPLYETGSLDRMLEYVRFPSRAAAVALGGFGLLAVVLAVTGIRGIVAYAVSRRQRELGIRIAIGASRTEVLKLVLERMAVLLAAGAMVGLLLSTAAARLLATIVYQASPHDPVVLACVCAAIILVGIIGCWGPARQSLRIDPMIALRSE
jgi:predicted permease